MISKKLFVLFSAVADKGLVRSAFIACDHNRRQQKRTFSAVADDGLVRRAFIECDHNR
jgi:hypothetical protein